MRGRPLFWGVVILLPTAHFLLHVGLGLGAWAPDLLTVGVLVIARQVRTGTAAGIGFALGLMEDALSILSFGANALALTVVGILGGLSRELFLGESVRFLIAYLALGIWLRRAIHWLLTGAGSGEEAFRVMLVEGPMAALYAAVVGTIILIVTGVWTREVGR